MSSKGETVLPATLKEALSTVNTGGDWMSAADGMSGFGSRRYVGFLSFSQTRDRNATRVTDGAVSGGIEEYRGGRLSCVEFDAFAVPRGQRVRRFEQCLEVVKRLWTEDNVSFENDICKLTNVTMTCRPIQQPYPPIWLAANNDRAVKRAARLGDSWFVNPHASIPEITRQLALYRAELAGLGKPFPRVLPYAREILCAKDKATALEMAGPYLSEKYQTYAKWGQDEVLPGDDTFRQPFEELLRDRFVLGSPDECYEQLRPCWEQAGANFLIFRTALERHAARPCTCQHAPD
jgi:alkanesulfonate monooxygenase SsuD/methylene tetrahydromethanopterin reductase-like flavin-dependent oxidoreductase (luciferase family)